MECWLFEILRHQCRWYPKYLNFLDSHKKDIRFTSIEGNNIGFTIDNVTLKLEDARSVMRVCNIGGSA
jgi:hypothetical protein